MIVCGGKWSTRSAKMCQESPRSCKYDNNVQSSGSGIAFEMLPIHPRALDGNVALKYDHVLSHERWGNIRKLWDFNWKTTGQLSGRMMARFGFRKHLESKQKTKGTDADCCEDKVLSKYGHKMQAHL